MTSPRSHLTGLSKKSTEAQTLRILRINASTPTTVLTAQSDRGNKSVRSVKPIVARVRKAGEAAPQTMSWNGETYKPGMGEFQLYGGRPGCMDFMKYKTFGVPT